MSFLLKSVLVIEATNMKYRTIHLDFDLTIERVFYEFE